ncbi:MAG: hypothetical protein NVS1B2_18690 [Vulcanimicrobiaceae bacterium]
MRAGGDGDGSRRTRYERSERGAGERFERPCDPRVKPPGLRDERCAHERRAQGERDESGERRQRCLELRIRLAVRGAAYATASPDDDETDDGGSTARECDRPAEREPAQTGGGKGERPGERAAAATATAECRERRESSWEKACGKDKRRGFEESTRCRGERGMQRGRRHEGNGERHGDPLVRRAAESRLCNRSYTK